jgi:hypothetical protein
MKLVLVACRMLSDADTELLDSQFHPFRLAADPFPPPPPNTLPRAQYSLGETCTVLEWRGIRLMLDCGLHLPAMQRYRTSLVRFCGSLAHTSWVTLVAQPGSCLWTLSRTAWARPSTATASPASDPDQTPKV